MRRYTTVCFFGFFLVGFFIAPAGAYCGADTALRDISNSSQEGEMDIQLPEARLRKRAVVSESENDDIYLDNRRQDFPRNRPGLAGQKSESSDADIHTRKQKALNKSPSVGPGQDEDTHSDTNSDGLIDSDERRAWKELNTQEKKPPIK